MARVSIHIVAWNSMRYLPQALETIARQTYRDFSVVVVDNASNDGVMEFIRTTYPTIATLRNVRNRGFAGGHNQAIEMARSLWARQTADGDTTRNEDRLVLVTNPDILLEPNFLEELVKAVDAHPECGSFGGKLRKVESQVRADEKEEPHKTELIDSTGLLPRKNRSVVERGAGAPNGPAYDTSEPVFGVSGALACYRLAALEAAAVPKTDGTREYYDEDFFAYKEDVDLAWRLQRLGMGSWYQASAVAWHYRTAKGSEKRSLLTAIRERREKSKLVNLYSTRNGWLLLLKNDTLGSLLHDIHHFLPFEFFKLAYLLVMEPRSLAAIPQTITLLGKMRAKRKAIDEKVKTMGGQGSARKWFV